eukprot:scaffold3560_cov124-Isochrysis_galbana.AAC.3
MAGRTFSTARVASSATSLPLCVVKFSHVLSLFEILECHTGPKPEQCAVRSAQCISIRSKAIRRGNAVRRHGLETGSPLGLALGLL